MYGMEFTVRGFCDGDNVTLFVILYLMLICGLLLALKY